MAVGLAALALLLLGAVRAGAAPITWGSPTNISGDTDVDTTGTLFGALNIGPVGVPPTMVNGVPFQGAVLPTSMNSVTLGNNFMFQSTSNFGTNNAGSGSAPFSTLSAAYRSLLSNFGGGFAGAPLTLTITGLTVGHHYEFQWWYDLSFGVGPFMNTATAGNSRTLQSSPSGVDGQLGQFAIGTFTADSSQETIAFSGAQTLLNGLQLRDLNPAAAVPEPSSFALLSLGGLGLAGWRRWKGRRPQNNPAA
jgi:hypothetical protein